MQQASTSHFVSLLSRRSHTDPATQIREVKVLVEAAQGEEYYADGLKLIFTGRHIFAS